MKIIATIITIVMGMLLSSTVFAAGCLKYGDVVTLYFKNSRFLTANATPFIFIPK